MDQGYVMCFFWCFCILKVVCQFVCCGDDANLNNFLTRNSDCISSPRSKIIRCIRSKSWHYYVSVRKQVTYWKLLLIATLFLKLTSYSAWFCVLSRTADDYGQPRTTHKALSLRRTCLRWTILFPWCVASVRAFPRPSTISRTVAIQLNASHTRFSLPTSLQCAGSGVYGEYGYHFTICAWQVHLW